MNKYDLCHVYIEDEWTELKTSGTEMLYKFLKKNNYIYNTCTLKCRADFLCVENFVRLTRNYDTWHWVEIKNGLICKQINDLLYLYGRDRFIRWCLAELETYSFDSLSEFKFSPKEYVVLEINQKQIDEYIEDKNESMFFTELCGRPCGVVFADRYVSELGNKLCTIHPEIDFVVMIDIADCKVSYRSVKDDIKLGEDIASKFGGGGHPKAAVSEFSKDMQEKIFEMIFRK